MAKQRVLAIWLDGYEEGYAARLMDAGDLPRLAELRERSARFLLEYDYGQRTGLAGEHIATGLAPGAGGRMASVAFDPKTYGVYQEGGDFQPFAAHLQARTVVFDPTYFRIDKAPNVRGIVAWGGHDPGTRLTAQPPEALDDLIDRFGVYPGNEWLYGFAWPSAERCRLMGESLAAATATRAHAACWLLAERLPDWDLALVGVSELHSASEGLWHGVDSEHPLHGHASTEAASEGLRRVYRAVDALVGELTDAFADAIVVAFTLGGMGPNRSDLQSMVLLPELLYRQAFGGALLISRGADASLPEGNEGWTAALRRSFPEPLRDRAAAKVRGARWHLRRLLRLPEPVRPRSDPLKLPLTWMPATRYQRFWPKMRAFALPAFYDGRVRINLAGRERSGVVPLERYDALCAEIEALLRECRDPATGEPVVASIERYGATDPMAIGPNDSDLIVIWSGAPTAIEHPKLGRIGPVPVRRPGGHTGPHGMAYIAGSSLPVGDAGVFDAFDVMPTLIDLLGESLPGLSGESLLRVAARPV